MVEFEEEFEDDDGCPDMPYLHGVSNLYMFETGDPRLPVEFSMMESADETPGAPALIYIVEDDPEMRAAAASHEIAHFKLKHHRDHWEGRLGQLRHELQAIRLQVLQSMSVDEWSSGVREETIKGLATYVPLGDPSYRLAWATGQVDRAEQAARKSLGKAGLL